MANEVVDVADKLALFSERWSPKVAARLNDYELKVVKVRGAFVWHTHEDTDELFLVVDGELTIQLRNGDATLHPDSCSSHREVSSIARSQKAKSTRCSSSQQGS